MKKLLSLSTLLILLLTLFSCTDEDQINLNDSSDKNNEIVKKNNKTSKSGSLVESKLYSGSGEILMIHDIGDQEVFFLQLNSGHTISEFTGDDAYISTDNDTLFVENGSTLNTYTFGNDIFGIGSISYSSSQNDNVIIMDDYGNWILNDTDHYPEVKCGCFTTGSSFPTNCDSGGYNSGGCSVGSSGGDRCSVGCDSGSDACCTLDNDFTFS